MPSMPALLCGSEDERGGGTTASERVGLNDHPRPSEASECGRGCDESELDRKGPRMDERIDDDGRGDCDVDDSLGWCGVECLGGEFDREVALAGPGLGRAAVVVGFVRR